jgi:histidine phosphotransferase ChpT
MALGALDLAALLCSRVCHDLISPVGAIVNGIEVLEEDKDEETRTFALDLIKKSARNASARLQFCRLAFGAAGSAGSQIDTGDAEKSRAWPARGRQGQNHLEPPTRAQAQEPG